jgi:glycosyltransferase 2 family protein
MIAADHGPGDDPAARPADLPRSDCRPDPRQDTTMSQSSTESLAAASPRGWRRRLAGLPWRKLRIAISLVLLAVLLILIDLGEAAALIARTDPALFAAMLALALGDRVLSAYRWWMLLPDGPGVTFLRVQRLIFVSSFLGYFMPGAVGVEITRAYGFVRTTKDLGRALSSLLVERVLAMIMLALLVLFGLLLSPPDLLPAAIPPLAAAGLVCLVLGMALLMTGWFRRLTFLLLPGTPLAPVRAKLAEVYDALDTYRVQPGRMVWAAAVALVFQLGGVAIAVAGAWALGSELGIVPFLVIVPVVSFLAFLPISVGGFGVRELGFVSLFGLVGMSPAMALSLAFLVHAVSILAVAPGAWLYWRRGLAL